jgi:DNA repair exonuclease SbcCD ATPase subunit
MKRIPTLHKLEPRDPLIPELLSIVDTIAELLKMRASDMKARSKLQERLAKAESDVSMVRKKTERLEDALKEKEKKIGELENAIHASNSHAKKALTKSKAEGFEKEKLKANKNMVSSLFDHELKKKDIEIAKLKDALKKSSLLHKDRIDTATKYSRFELNNFYDGIEKDFNILDSKKTEIYRNMIDECNEFRSFLVELYTSLINTVKASRRGSQADIQHTLNPNSLNKPFIHCREDVKISFVALYNDLRSLLV